MVRTAGRLRTGVRSLVLTAAAVTAAAAMLAACSTAPSTGVRVSNGGVIQVIAAENFWGSIASQVGGAHVHVVSVISNPNTDPHAYEPTAIDARNVALAQLVIENGIGYDTWMSDLVAASQGSQVVLNVGTVLGVPPGGNPHRWYNPADVRAVVRAMVTDYSRLDPANAGYFRRRQAYFETVALRQYDRLIATIRARYGGTPVGASESIFAMLAPALGLRLITPYSFLKAISEGTEVSAADKQTIDNQIRRHLIKIYVYNSQNVTPDVQTQLTLARAEHIPVTRITETLTPPNDTYQAWQVRQLQGIEAALARGTGH